MVDAVTWLLSFFGVIRIAVGAVIMCMVFPAHAVVLELSEAQATILIQEQMTQVPVQLPYHWDSRHSGFSGEAVFDLPFELGEVPEVPYGLYLPRLGNAYEVWLNGVLLERNGDLQHYNGADYAKVPRHILISPGLLRKSNELRVHIRTDMGRRGGLSTMTLGPDAEVYPIYLNSFRWRGTGSLAVVVLSLSVGLMAMALWATQVDAARLGRSRRDPLYLWAGVAELSWTFSISDALIENPPITWPWWGIVAFFTSSMWVASMTLFCVEVAGWTQLRAIVGLRRWLGLLLITSILAGATSLIFGYPIAMVSVYVALGLTSLAFALFFFRQTAQAATVPHKMVSAVLVFNALVGLRDLYVFRIALAYGSNTWLRYGTVLFGLSLGYIVLMRFRSASHQARDLMANLSDRVAQKEKELQQTYQRLELLAREQERTKERARILQDMHDGVGAHISTAIRQLNSGKATDEEVSHTLHESLDQLKLSIDAMNLPPGDVSALLANLRYRLQPRFTSSDLELHWNVDLLPVLERLDDKGMRHLQFMVYGAMSNVMQHAQATVMGIRAFAKPEGVELLILDNGCGFDTASPLKKGLLHMHERAAAIGAVLTLRSEPGRTVVGIFIALP